MNRYESDETKKELISSLSYIFPIGEVIELSKEDVITRLEATKKGRGVNSGN